MPGSIVILWWGTDIRILTTDGKASRFALGKTEDPVPGILRIVEDARAAGQAARIIYHPDTLDAHEISCPNTSRSRLRKILSREYRALGAPDAVWSAEPIRKGPRGYATVLYIDNRSRLPRLLEGLAGGGVRVEGVWPLQSLIEVIPPCDAAEGSFLSLVAVGGQTLVSCVGPSGDRSVRFFDGDESADAAIAEMRAVLARFDEGATPRGLMVVEESPKAGALADAPGTQALTGMPPAAFLGHARLLPMRGFSDFLRRQPFFARPPALRRMGALAGLALAMGSAWFAWGVRQDQVRAQQQAASLRERHVELQQWIASRVAIGKKIGELTQALGSVQGPAQPHYEFLAALARATPKAIALQSVMIQDGAFAIKGRVYGEAGRSDNPLLRFRRDLAEPEEPWRLQAAPSGTADAGFVLTGSFQFPPGKSPNP
jgi:hypothetical protein